MTIFTKFTVTFGTSQVLPLSWLPANRFNRFNLIVVDETGLTGGAIILELSPDDGVTWLPITGLSTMTKAGGPYQVQIPFDKLRVRCTGSAGSAQVWVV